MLSRNRCCSTLLVVLFALAQHPAMALDLGSTEHNSIAPASGHILMNGRPMSISKGELITAAQYLALTQVLGSGAQTLKLGVNGAATGGTAILPGSSLTSNLVVPVGVLAVTDFSRSATVNLTGNIVNSGTIYAVSNNAAINNATFNAASIFNQSGATLTSVNIPGLPNFAGSVRDLSLSLNAVQDIINSGTISSARGLSLTAGNSIQNLGGAAAMWSRGDTSLQTPLLLNQGTIQSAGNLLASGTNNVLNVTNAGSIAAGGALSFQSLRDISSVKPVLNVQGGTLSGSSVNFKTADGAVNVSVSDLVGDVNIHSGTANLAVTNGSHGLNIKTMDLSGDPNIVFNGSGDFVSAIGTTLGGFVDVTTTGSITFNSAINTTPVTANTAGGSVTLNAGTTVSLQSIVTSGTGSGAAGPININANGLVTTGQITAPGAVVTINTTGDITLSAAGTWNLGSTTYKLNAAGTSIIESTGGNLVAGTKTVSNNSGNLVLQAPNGTLDLRSPISARITAASATGTVSLLGAGVNMASGGSLNVSASGNLGTGFVTGTLIQATTNGISFPAGAQTINFQGSGGELHDLSPGANYPGLSGTSLTINSAGDVHFLSNTFNNVGGSITANVDPSAFHVAQFDTTGAGTQKYSNIHVNGGPLGVFATGAVQLGGTISTTAPGVPGGGGMTIVSGNGCVNCPNTSTGITVLPGAHVTSDKGFVIIMVEGTDTNPATVADPSRALIDIGAGSVIQSTGAWSSGSILGGAVQLSVNSPFPPTPLQTTLNTNRPTLNATTSQIDYINSGQTFTGATVTRSFGSGVLSASGGGTVQFDDAGVANSVQGSGSVSARGGLVYIAAHSYVGELQMNGQIVGSLPFNPPPSPVVIPPVVTPPTTPPGGPPTTPPGGISTPPTIFPPTTVVSSDVTSNRSAAVGQSATTGLTGASIVQSTDVVPNGQPLVATACQRFIIDRDAFIVGSAGTRFTPNAPNGAAGPEQIELSSDGKVMAMSGDKGLRITAGENTVNIPANSSAIVERTAHGGIAVSSISGRGTVVMVGSQNNQIPVNDGEQVSVADDDEDLIPTSGDVELLVTARITIASRRVQTARFNKKEMAEKEKLLLCVSGVGNEELKKKLRDRLHEVIDGLKAADAAQEQGAKNDRTRRHSSSPLRPVAFSELAAAHATSGRPVNVDVLQTCTVRDNGDARLIKSDDGRIALTEGTALISADRPTVIQLGATLLDVKPNACILVTKDGGNVKVENLYESKLGSVQICIGSKHAVLYAGAEVIISPDEQGVHRLMTTDDVGRRSIRELPMGKMHVTKSEVSLHSVLRTSPLMQSIVSSKREADKGLTNKLIKMAAVLSSATAGNGRYESTAAK